MEHLPLLRPHFFFTTAPMPCPYLDGRMERKIVTELTGNDARRFHDTLSRAGFRRSHSIAYAPACVNCSACVPVRVVVAEFRKNRTFRRLWEANRDLRARVVPARATAEQYRLFNAYQEKRHTGSDMALMGFYDYRAMVEDSPINTSLVEFRDDTGALKAVCLMDRMDDGLSGVYSFYETETPSLSLGTYVVLWLINAARTYDLPYVYLGYWIHNSQKMAYKQRFQPLEAYSPSGWNRLESRPYPPP